MYRDMYNTYTCVQLDNELSYQAVHSDEIKLN